MSRFHKYELLHLVQSGAIETYRARAIHSGRIVFLHLLRADGTPSSRRALVKQLKQIMAAAPGTAELSLQPIDESTAVPFIETEVIEPFDGLEKWLTEQCQEARHNAHRHRKEKILCSLAAADYTTAAHLARDSLVDFPHDAEFLNTAKMVESLERFQELFDEARSQTTSPGEPSTSLEYELSGKAGQPEVPRSPSVSVKTVSSIPRPAPAGNGALHTHGVDESVENWREKFALWCFAQALRLQSRQDFDGARAIAGQGLACYRGYPQKAASFATDAVASSVAQETPSESLALESSAATESEVTAAPASRPTAARLRWRQKVVTIREAAERLRKAKPLVPALGAAAAVALMGVAIAWMVWNGSGSRPATASMREVQLRSSPPGATILINGEECGVSTCELNLAAGSYRTEARLAGYEPAISHFEITGQDSVRLGPSSTGLLSARHRTGKNTEGSIDVLLNLPPRAPRIRLSSDLGQATVSLDGEAVGRFEDGSFELDLDPLESGEHTLTVSNRQSEASIRFRTSPGTIPLIRGPMETRNMRAVVVAGLEDQVRVQGSSGLKQATLDEVTFEEPQLVQGVQLTDLRTGPHELSLDLGRQKQNLVFENEPRPTLTAFLGFDPGFADLRIFTGEDDATVFINGKKYRRTKGGRLLARLQPQQYRIRVEKEGFQSPPEKIVALRRGDRLDLDFSLTPEPQTSTLLVRNGFPGTEVVVDGTPVGRVGPDGVFSLDQLEPGPYSVALSKPPYKTKEFEPVLMAGGAVELDGLLERAVGTLHIDVKGPESDVRLSLRREGETIDRAITDRTLTLAEGAYTVRASAPGYEDAVASVQLAADAARTAHLALRPRPERMQPAVSLDDWESRRGYERESGQLVLTGGKFALSPVEPTAGTYEFAAKIKRGKRLEWIVNYINENNYALYRLGKDYLERIQVINGDESAPFRLSHELNPDDFVRVRIEVTRDSAIHKIMQNGEWIVIDRWVHTGAGFAEGSFGFHVPGKSQVGLRDFRFIPRT